MRVHVDREFLVMWLTMSGGLLFAACLVSALESQYLREGFIFGLASMFRDAAWICLVGGLAFACAMTAIEYLLTRYPKCRPILLALFALAYFYIFFGRFWR